jgi:hypothetical protein
MPFAISVVPIGTRRDSDITREFGPRGEVRQPGWAS